MMPQMHSQQSPRQAPSEAAPISLLGYDDMTRPILGRALSSILQYLNITPNVGRQLTIRHITAICNDEAYDVSLGPNGTLKFTFGGRDTVLRNSENILGGDCEKFISAIRSATPYPKITPEDPRDPNSILAADLANEVASDTYNKIDMRRRIEDIARIWWQGGTVYTYVYVRRTGRRIKVPLAPTIESPKLDPEEADPNSLLNLMMPEESDPLLEEPIQGLMEVDEYTIDFYSTDGTEVTIPPGHRSVETLPWLRFDEEVFNGSIVAQYGTVANWLVGQPDNLNTPYIPIEVVGHKHYRQTSELPTRSTSILSRTWLKPDTYYYAMPQDAKFLLDNFPDGIVIHSCDGRILRVSKGQLTNWVIQPPGGRSNLLAQPIAKRGLSTAQQIGSNNVSGTKAMNRSLPTTFIAAHLASKEELESLRNNSYDTLRVHTAAGADLSRFVYSSPGATIQRELVPFNDSLRNAFRDTLGTNPTIFGGGPIAPTFREGESRRNAAMAQLTNHITAASTWTANVMRVILRLKSEYAIEKVTRGHREIYVHLRLPLHGYHVTAVPEAVITDQQAADSIGEIFHNNDANTLEALELLSPVNRQRVHQLLRLPGLVSTAANIGQYVDQLMQVLLYTENGADEQGPIPAVNPDPDVEDARSIIDGIVFWLTDIKGGVAYKTVNPEGYARVRRYLLSYKQIVAEQEQAAKEEEIKMAQALGTKPKASAAE